MYEGRSVWRAEFNVGDPQVAALVQEAQEKDFEGRVTVEIDLRMKGNMTAVMALLQIGLEFAAQRYGGELSS